MKANDRLARSELAFETEINKCVLCYDAPCKKIYKNIDPSRVIRAIKFDNRKGARALLNKNKCLNKNLVNAVHNDGKELYAWTVNTEESISEMIDMNVDNIITDNIELGKELVKKSKSTDLISKYIKMIYNN